MGWKSHCKKSLNTPRLVIIQYNYLFIYVLTQQTKLPLESMYEHRDKQTKTIQGKVYHLGSDSSICAVMPTVMREEIYITFVYINSEHN
jgi:hypothetical protein